MTESDSYIQTWLVGAGATVRAGTPLLVVETTQAETEIESPADGIVGERLVAADSEVPPGTVLTWIESES